MTDLKILVVGLGSIGKRHLRNMLTLGYKNVFAVTSKKNFDAEFSSIIFFQTIKEAFDKNSFHSVFICTPTSFHIQNLLQVLQYNISKIYVEKPISNSYEKIKEVIEISKKKNVQIFAGYDLHFDKGILKVKNWIDQHKIGEIISVNAFVGQHLRQWRPAENHKTGMSAKKETGGGVLFDLIHEFDYLIWILGDIQKVACNCINSGFLEIETEEAADVLIKFSSGTSGTIHLDYLQQKIMRFCIFTGTQGTIKLDLVNQCASVINENNEKDEFRYFEERNDRFINVIKTFFENETDEKLTNFNNGLKSLRTVLAAKKSSEENNFTHVY